ncbi:DgyrCDS14535 [Dimorphilus gyrociliatus]|uniref:DgyrCDS14535 n=1 Tax=Dimorphilus gyrociliatus TaxID=2664684 RepID=A0A7I8WDW9_9ANNE|nr:DgyrCDS14535 [Dimorphilus gyrociliatus]
MVQGLGFVWTWAPNKFINLHFTGILDYTLKWLKIIEKNGTPRFRNNPLKKKLLDIQAPSLPELMRELNYMPSCHIPEINHITDRIYDIIKGSEKINRAQKGLENQGLMKNFLNNHSNIIIKPADKGRRIVLMDKEDYVFEAMTQLCDRTTYKQVSNKISSTQWTRLNEILNELVTMKIITKSTATLMAPQNSPGDRKFYLLPKIHKHSSQWRVPNRIPKGRPVDEYCSEEAEIPTITTQQSTNMVQSTGLYFFSILANQSKTVFGEELVNFIIHSFNCLKSNELILNERPKEELMELMFSEQNSQELYKLLEKEFANLKVPLSRTELQDLKEKMAKLQENYIAKFHQNLQVKFNKNFILEQYFNHYKRKFSTMDSQFSDKKYQDFQKREIESAKNKMRNEKNEFDSKLCQIQRKVNEREEERKKEKQREMSHFIWV